MKLYVSLSIALTASFTLQPSASIYTMYPTVHVTISKSFSISELHNNSATTNNEAENFGRVHAQRSAATVICGNAWKPNLRTAFKEGREEEEGISFPLATVNFFGAAKKV